MNACLSADVPVLLVRVLLKRVEVSLPDHCHVGFAVMLTISATPFLKMKKPETFKSLGLWLGSTIKIIYARNLDRFETGSDEFTLFEYLPSRQG